MRYLLGVDGGNTKTDYLLCREDGSFMDVYRCGTCSHEAFDDSFDGMERAMRTQLDTILSRNHLTVADIAAAGFGLAGADLPGQIEELTKRIAAIGFTCFTVANDGILGIKAASDGGVGLCVVNGTGTVVIGIDTRRQILQVGGVGDISGDRAGGGYALRQIMYGLYAYYYRCGDYSSLFPAIMELLQLKPEDLLVAVGDYRKMHQHTVDILQMADQAAQAGDAVAQKVFDDMGVTMGHSAAGCVKLLHFDEPIGTDDHPLPIVLVGSIWHKIAYTGMKTVFGQTFRRLSGKAYELVPLTAPAAVGGVLWAKEMLDNVPVAADYRQKVLASLTLERYESLVYAKEQ